MDKIIIRDLRVRGIIGVNDWERKQLRDILINIEIDTDLQKAGTFDKLEDSISYSIVAKNVVAYVEKAQRFTVEALAEDIAAICLKEPGALNARVRVEKPGAVHFAKSVGVEIERPAKN